MKNVEPIYLLSLYYIYFLAKQSNSLSVKNILTVSDNEPFSAARNFVPGEQQHEQAHSTAVEGATNQPSSLEPLPPVSFSPAHQRARALTA